MQRADGQPVRDLRDYLDLLAGRGDILEISDEVDPLDEMGAIIARADTSGMNKAIMFKKAKGSTMPVLANTVGSTYKRIAEAFGVSEGNAVAGAAAKMGKIMMGGTIPPVVVDPAKAPCREVVLKGNEVDLGLIPVLRLNPEDGGGPRSTEGRFISSLACSQPSADAHNLSYHRFEIQGANQGTVWVFRLTGDARSIEESWGVKIGEPEDASKGKPFPMAYVIGVTPEFLLTGANPGMPPNYNDFAFIGGLMGRPVELVKCETIDVMVPANAEIVVEGIMRPFNLGRSCAQRCGTSTASTTSRASGRSSR